MRMIKSFFKFSFGSWIAAAISFFTTPIITLLIIPEEFGRTLMFYFASSIILQIVLIGNDQSFMRFFYEKDAKDNNSLLWNSLLPSFFILGFIVALLLYFWRPISIWLIAEEQILVVILLTVLLFLLLVDRYSSQVIRMQNKGTIFSVLKIVTSITNVIFIVIYCHYVSRSFYAIIWAGIISAFITIVVSILYEKKIWFSGISVSRNEIIRLLKYGIPFAPACLMSILFQGMDKFFLREYSGFEEMGLYSAAFKIVTILIIVQNGFSMFWTPVSFEHYEKHPEDTSLYENTYKVILFIITLLGLLLIGCKDLIILIFARNYAGAASIMPFLIFLPVLYTLTEITCLGVYFKKKSIWQLYIFSILIVISLGFNFLLVPLYNAKGAAMALALSYIVYFFLRTIVSVRLYPMKFNMVKSVVSVILLFFVAWINTFIASIYIGIISVIIALIFYLLYNIPVIKYLFVYFKENLLVKENI